jgi:predicted metal-dependent HD superfamily phosphohydrolase
MKTIIEDMTVTMKFTIRLGDVEVSDGVYRGLEKISEELSITDSKGAHSSDPDIVDAFEWLNDNIHSRDACDWEYSVDIED